jgi:hypothetical protein
MEHRKKAERRKIRGYDASPPPSGTHCNKKALPLQEEKGRANLLPEERFIWREKERAERNGP